MDVSFKAAIKDSLDLIASRYSRDLFNSSVSIAFDLTTDIDVGGDSAGVALGLATLSCIKKIPLDKKLAVTGSVRRYGDVRPVGGVYHKGKAAFYYLCLVLLLPSQNMGNFLSCSQGDSRVAMYLLRQILAKQQEQPRSATIERMQPQPTPYSFTTSLCFHQFEEILTRLWRLRRQQTRLHLSTFHRGSWRCYSVLPKIEPSMSPQVASLIKTVSTAHPAATVMAADGGGNGATIQARPLCRNTVST